MPKRNFARCYLPWLAVAAMLLVYLFTLTRTITVSSAWPLARAMGVDWRPVYTAPLNYLVTEVVGLLPSGIQLLGLNFIAALCAALSLGLLARCVAILPHDRTQMQRDRSADETSFLNLRLAWVPVVIAVLICGLQRTFWENAIVGTGEALDLLLFAYCVRCLLEFRVEGQNSWLYKLALVYGLGLTNNYALVAFFPALLVALVWMKGWKFFRFDFLVKMFLLGLAGLSLYLLLPLVQSQSDINSVSFWTALKTNLVAQKNMVIGFRRVGLLPAIYALVPLLILAIRWSSSFGDQSPMGSAFANGAAIILHAGLLAFCIYVAFDPPISPREVAAQARESIPVLFVFLPCYFLGALAAGYFSGFLLLLAGGKARRSSRQEMVPSVFKHALTVLVCGGAIYAVGRLYQQNHGHIRALTSRAFHNYSEALMKSLPEKPSVLMSDDALRLHAVRAQLGASAASKHILIDTGALPDPAYQRFLRQRYGDRLPKLRLKPGATHPTQLSLVQFVAELGRTHELVYLHPSFGYYFETFYAEPSKLVYLLKPYAPDMTDPPVVTGELMVQQAAFWNALATGPFQELKSDLARLPSDSRKQQDSDPSFVGSYYSRALNHWGFDLQRAGRFEEAAPVFEQAIALNPENVAALINREMNSSWRKDRTRLVKLSKETEEKLGHYRAGLTYILGVCGPIDEASFALEVANMFANGNLFRQAGQLLRRSLYYSPDEVYFQAALANLEVLSLQPDRALALLQAVRSRPQLQTNAPAVQVEVARVESLAHFAKGDFQQAEQVLTQSLSRFPAVDAAYDNLWRLYVGQAERLRHTNTADAAGIMTNALRVVDRQLRLQPKNAAAWFNHGNLCIFINDYEQAIQSFTTVLRLQKDHSAALLNRAIANLRSQKLEAAQKDYVAMLKLTTTSFQVYYGLGDIAYQQKNWKEARSRYEQYLRYAGSADAQERELVRQRLDELKKK